MSTIHTRRLTGRIKIGQIALYALLSFGGFLMIFPYLWMVSTSFKARGTWYNINLIPDTFSVEHYDRLLSTSLLPRWYLNTVVVAVIGTVSVVFFSSLAGYAFSKYHFRGREAMFLMILATIMIPSEMMIIPWYVGVAKIGWIDSIPGILMPGLLSVFGVFVMRQFIANIPDELLDAGRIDGVSEFGLFWRICLPLSRPAVAVVAIFTFLGHWNDFLWPLIVINSNNMQTLQVGLSRLSSLETGADWGGTMSGAALASIPMLIVFLFFQKQIVNGMRLSGLKG
ncbi:MAG: carbohydrate ABC transporter permease [Chloroflexi bacterium]|nr:MAG: carbohydrate ABC transporter permease [Chloroflexota bacterium]